MNLLARGKHFNHQNKNHPGNLPKSSVTGNKTTEAQEDEEFLVIQEAFKNRIEGHDGTEFRDK